MLVSQPLITLVSLALAFGPSFTVAAPFNFRGRNRFGGNNQGCSVSVSTKLVTVTVTANPGNTPAPANPINNNGGNGQATTTNAPNPTNTPPSNNNGNGNGNGATTRQTTARPGNTAVPPPINNGGATTTNRVKPTTTPAPGTQSGGLPVTSISSQTLSGATTLNNAVSTTSGSAPATPTGNTGDDSDPQTSFNLDPRVIGPNFANDGQDEPAVGQVPSLTTTNNFINYCMTLPNLPITNGEQIQTGSCNPIPIGAIPSTQKMPTSKFTFPPNFGTIRANEAFTVSMAINNLVSGNFVNAKASYFAAPQQLSEDGTIIGHTHVVIERINSFDDTTVTNPKVFEFFKGLNGVAQNGILTADVTKGLTPGFFRLASINAASNHQPVIVPIAQHGSLDDMIYFEVTEDGEPTAPNTPAPETPAPVTETDAPSSVVPEPTESASEAVSTTASEVEVTATPTEAPESEVAEPSSAAEEVTSTATEEITSAPVATPTQEAGAGGNLQKFSGALGNQAAPAVTVGGRGFRVEGSDDFLNVAAALQRSCDIQKNKCADFANANRNAGFTVGDCDKQAGDCRAAN